MAQSHRATPRTTAVAQKDTAGIEVFSDTTGTASAIDDTIQQAYHAYQITVDPEDAEHAFGLLDNVVGGMFNYGVGRMGKLEWIEKYLHVKKKDLDRAERFMAGHGAWMGFFAFLPLLGSAITIALGLMRANIPISILSITIGKFLRYLLLVYGVSFFIS